MADLVDSDGWVPLLDTTNDGPVTSDMATQTEGLFYPSSRTISKAMAATEAVLTSWTVKKPQGGTYSPGRGNSNRLFMVKGVSICTIHSLYRLLAPTT